MKMNNDPNWIREKAAREDGCSVSAGLSVAEMTNQELLRLMDPVLSEYPEALREIEARLVALVSACRYSLGWLTPRSEDAGVRAEIVAALVRSREDTP